ncbi:hypothetical protein ACUSIJ_07990 [Pseudochelatococcus sp. B33]
MKIRPILRVIHIAAGVAAFFFILRFLGQTAWAEFGGQAGEIAAAKGWIVSRLPALIAALAVVGATGFLLAGRQPRGLAAAKLRRMQVIAPNGLLILMPAALFLNWKAGAHAFDTAFVAVQSVEIAAGLVNLALVGLNIRDGLRMRGRLPA